MLEPGPALYGRPTIVHRAAEKSTGGWATSVGQASRTPFLPRTPLFICSTDL